MFDNNFGKCGPSIKIGYFHWLIREKIIYVTDKDSTSRAICCYTTL